MQTFNGIGTTLYGKRYLTKKELHSMSIDVKEGNPYIATEWFVLIFVPIIPLGSYVIFAESGKSSNFMSTQKQYHMVKINMNWNQIFKAWAITTGIIFLLWVLF